MTKSWETTTLEECPKRPAPSAACTIGILPSFLEGEIAHATAIPNQVSEPAAAAGLAELFYILEGNGRLWRGSGGVDSITPLSPHDCVTITPGVEYQFRADGGPMKFLVATTRRFDPDKHWCKGKRRYWNADGEASNPPLQPGPWTTTKLPTPYNYLAPDGSEIRLLPTFDAGGLAHCRLPAGAISAPVRHKTVKEVWYVLAGRGDVWRGQGAEDETVRVEPDTCLTIPTGVSFQFRALGDGPLEIMIGTFPAWPGPDEAEPVKGKWEIPFRLTPRPDHAALRVRDYDASVRWYTDKLDFRVVREWRSGDLRFCYLENRSTKLEIIGGGTMQPSPVAPDFETSLRHPGYHHLSLMVEAVDVVLAKLGGRGVTVVHGPLDLPEIGRRLAFIRDDNGTMIELVGRL